MAEFTLALAANNPSSSRVCNILRRRASDYYLASILVYGTFGSGTVALFISPDNGTTLIPLTNVAGGPAITFAANGMQLVNFGNPNTNTQNLSIWATLSGATNPSLTVAVYDNR